MEKFFDPKNITHTYVLQDPVDRRSYPPSCEFSGARLTAIPQFLGGASPQPRDHCNVAVNIHILIPCRVLSASSVRRKSTVWGRAFLITNRSVLYSICTLRYVIWWIIHVTENGADIWEKGTYVMTDSVFVPASTMGEILSWA